MSFPDHDKYTPIIEDNYYYENPDIEEVFVGIECLDETYYELANQKMEIIEQIEEVTVEEQDGLSFWDINNIEENNEERTEENVIENFMDKVCCQKKCILHWTKEEILQFRADCRRLDYFENGKNLLDTVLLGIIRSMCKTKKIVKHARRTIEKERERLKLFFIFQGIEICETFFLFVHAIKIKRFRRLLKHYKNKGLQINVHGNTKKLPANTISLEHQSFVVKFIEQYAEDNGICMTGASYTLKVLPSDVTKVKVYRLYQTACKKRNTPHVGRSTFYSLWSQFCSHVVAQKPSPLPDNMTEVQKQKKEIPDTIKGEQKQKKNIPDTTKVEQKQKKKLKKKNSKKTENVTNTMKAEQKQKKNSKKTEVL